ncbi:hypothetical protein C7460_11321 [Marinoscillum furvescens DSM 4134]|uniref:Uncharacterized protein n=2 Tax=Marinoscillum furvescens TaxID=1026 RepID=A0A3D9L0J0_MARFU|nr:hypothetical protein C7460_11321 [Marinoscillum furvescens DSM 4134]
MCGMALSGVAQLVTANLPERIDTAEHYLFYLHDRILQEQGVSAVSDEHGTYEYMKILHTFASNGFHVISQPRDKGTTVSGYARRTANQILTLLQNEVPDSKISVIGAGMGAEIAVEVAQIVKEPSVSYVFMGLCDPKVLIRYQTLRGEIYGRFLSIFDVADSCGSCRELFLPLAAGSIYHEVVLSKGMGEGLYYKPLIEWVRPAMYWAVHKELPELISQTSDSLRNEVKKK